ncbi:MAG TPA: energy transducer TonB [Chitinophagales bacterium]|nr:energy transducer TonB [Chitinophagales bacterium]
MSIKNLLTFAATIQNMLSNLKKIFLLLLLNSSVSSAQQFTLYSSRSVDIGSKSVSKIHSVIYIDSLHITIEQGESHLYLDIKSQQRQEAGFFYTVLDYNDAECKAVFSPDEKTFDYQSAQYHLRYIIDSIVQEKKENAADTEESDVDADSTSTDSSAVKEDNTVYLSSDVPPEFPGGSDAMKLWLTENVKYPAAAKKDKVIGLAEVSAIVEKNGTLSDVKVKRDIGGGCGAEAVHAVKQMPTWIPGQIKNEDKRVKVTIKVFFPPK